MNVFRSLSTCLLLTVFAWAHDPAGSWTSSSGARIDLWANMEQVLVTVTTADGVSHKYQGYWTRFSDYFRYQVDQTQYDCAFQGGNQILVRGAGAPDRIWRRGWSGWSRPMRAPAASGDPSGLYLSSSGSSVQVTSQGGRLSIILVSRNGQSTAVSGQWVGSNRFEYYYGGNKAICTQDVNRPGRIVVQSPTGTTIWTRQ